MRKSIFNQLIFWLYLIFPFSLFAQSTIDTSPDSLIAKGNDLSNIGNQFYNSNLDSTLFYYKKAISYYKEAKRWDYYIVTLNACANISYRLQEYEDTEYFALQAIEESKQYLDKKAPPHLEALKNLSVLYSVKGNLHKAIKTQEEILAFQIQNGVSKTKLHDDYINLASLLSRSRDLSKALEYSSIAIDYYLEQPDVQQTKLAKFYLTHAYVFHQMEQLDSSIFYNHKIIEGLKQAPNSSSKKKTQIQAYHNLVKSYLLKKDINNANLSLNKALQLQKDEKAYRLAYSYELSSKILFEQDEFSKSETSILKAIDLIEKHAGKDLPGIAVKQLILANIQAEKKETKAALLQYQKALQTLSGSKEDLDFLQNPSPDQYFALNYVLRILEAKANYLWTLYQENENVDYLHAALDTYENASEVIQKMRQGFLSSESKNALSEKSTPVYEGAIKACFELYNRGKGDNYKEKAFTLAESNKAQLLLESLNEQTAKGFANIPDSLLQKEKTLRADIAFYEKSIIEKSQQQNTLKELKKLRSIVFNKQQQLDQLNNQFEKNYPRYFNLKYKNEPIAIEKIQQSLKGSNKAFLEYFVGEEDIYLFTLTSDQLDIQKIKNGKLVRNNVDLLRQALNNPPSQSFGKEALAEFVSTSNGLYKQLIQPALDRLNPSVKDWVIIPDYYLNYIPFDVLLRNSNIPSGGNLSHQAMDYLFEDFNISYDYSVRLHYKDAQEKQQDFESDFVGFAPAFNDAQDLASRTCTQDELYALKCSTHEIHSINAIAKGAAYIGPDASRQSFESTVSGSKIIHLATHACIDESNANYNKIFLTDDYLSDFDLYNMDLNAELAVLSACNTGSGELIKGEGVLSLARGFINAGCSSTVMSMWSVDDCATSDIMIYFYEGLKDGLSKEKALKSAKIKYLDAVDKSKMHPYYWAAFVPFGDMAAMEIGPQSNWLYYLFAGGLVLLLFLFLKKYK